MINIKDIVILSDDNSYVVVSKTNYEDKFYYYLIDINKTENIKFCVENAKNKSLIELEDANLIHRLLPLFLESSSSVLTDDDWKIIANNYVETS